MAFSYDTSLPLGRIPISIQLVGILLALAFLHSFYSSWQKYRPWRGIPVISLKEERGLSAKQSWFLHAQETIDKGLRTSPNVFQVMTGTGPRIVLPNRYVEDFKTTDFSFTASLREDFFAAYPGFEPFREASDHENFLPGVLRAKWTSNLGQINAALVDETSSAVLEIFGEDPEWHEVTLNTHVLQLMARSMSRVLVGKEMARSKRWLEIAKQFTVYVFTAARKLRNQPPLLRRIAYEFMEDGKILRAMHRDVTKMILPEIEMRKERCEEAREAGQELPKYNDTLWWLYESAQEQGIKLDIPAVELSLAMASIHSITLDLTMAIHRMCEHPEVIEPLREEIKSVISSKGWSKTAFYSLKLLDSFLKETQRYHPPTIVGMARLIPENFTLSDGTVLPGGSRIVVAGAWRDPEVYDSPDTFDPYRFYRMREKSDTPNSWQYASVSPQHLTFGYANHACPGRFLASNELKIALAYLLLRYDWKAIPDAPSPFIHFEEWHQVNPTSKVQIRRRREEIELDKVQTAD